MIIASSQLLSSSNTSNLLLILNCYPNLHYFYTLTELLSIHSSNFFDHPEKCTLI